MENLRMTLLDFPGGQWLRLLYFQCRVRGFSLWLGNSDLMCGMTENEKLRSLLPDPTASQAWLICQTHKLGRVDSVVIANRPLNLY